MKINISKKDIIWGYVAIVFSLATGLLTLPIILNKLTSEEVGMNYLMLSISSIVVLLDFGFAPQFGRNFTYVHSGAQTLLKEGYIEVKEESGINYHLLAVLLKTAKTVYLRISIVALFLMLTFGTWYISEVTDGFSTVKNSLAIWVTFSISTFYNIYYSYYISLLKGSGKMAESSIATISNKLTNLLISVLLLLCGFGLISIVIANLIAPFIQRFYTYRVYFTKDLRSNTNLKIERDEIIKTFKIIWYNAKKTGVGYLGAYAILNLGTFLMGLFLTLSEVASYGLILQLCSIVVNLSKSMFNTYIPEFNSLRVTGQMSKFKGLLSLNYIVFILTLLVGDMLILLVCPLALDIIHSNTRLPDFSITLVVVIMTNLEANHTFFSNIITTKNEIPFVRASLISGGIIGSLTFVLLNISSLRLWAVVLPQFIVQLCYNNWKWPLYVMNDLKISMSGLICLGFIEFVNKTKQLICK